MLAVGVGGLGIWGTQEHATRMESSIASEAETIANRAVHDVHVTVSGRDITAGGLANSPGEKEALIAALDAVPGRRVVRDELELLPKAEPFVMAATKTDGGMILQGNVPTEADRAQLSESGASGAEGLTLASGASPGWASAVEAGLAALASLDEGVFSMEDTRARLSGLARTPVERDQALEALNALPDGYAMETEFELRDDGTPPDVWLSWNIAEGAKLNGKLPAETKGADLAEALGVPLVADETKTGLVGGDRKDALLNAVKGLKPWLGQMDTAELRLLENAIALRAVATPGADTELLAAALRDDLAGMDITLETAAQTARAGAVRDNVLTGQKERFLNGFWLPDVTFRADERSCAQQSDSALREARIGFVSGSARLGPKAVTAVNRLASVVRKCVTEAGLTAELGGHTDSTGDAQRNFELSYDRALAVQAALVQRGVPEGAINAVGYGQNKPIADNATEEGRAMNRRTTIVWFAGE